MNWFMQVTDTTTTNTNELVVAATKMNQHVHPLYIRHDTATLDECCDVTLDAVPDSIFFGSIPLVKLVETDRRTFTPGTCHNDHFNYVTAIRDNGELMLNHDCIITDIDTITSEFMEEQGVSFIRPVLDLKSFNGGLVHPGWQFYRWKDAITLGGVYPNTGVLVLLSKPKTIHNEYRCFLIGEQAPEVRQYSTERGVGHSAVSPMVERDIQAFLLDVGTPHDMCVVDIAMTDDGYKVIEFNTMTASGMYGHDCDKLVRQIINHIEY